MDQFVNASERFDVVNSRVKVLRKHCVGLALGLNDGVCLSKDVWGPGGNFWDCHWDTECWALNGLGEWGVLLIIREGANVSLICLVDLSSLHFVHAANLCGFNVVVMVVSNRNLNKSRTGTYGVVAYFAPNWRSLNQCALVAVSFRGKKNLIIIILESHFYLSTKIINRAQLWRHAESSNVQIWVVIYETFSSTICVANLLASRSKVQIGYWDYYEWHNQAVLYLNI